ncbi:hypothetical protein LJR066_005739 [Acidovorax sp. LjRoot66]|uniref:hypothetical protein n=1 Tax=Acidovorax sp. LjRoot66 TaxID=3342334 RepID=UPI003ECE7949
MTSAFERMAALPAVLQPAVPTPTSLAARALSAPPTVQLSGTPPMVAPMLPQAPGPALKPRGVLGAPPLQGKAEWYGQHEKLVHRLLHMAVRAAVLPPGPEDKPVDELLAKVLQHAREIVEYELPTLLAKDGRNTIPFERLASARAKIVVLRQELKLTKAELAAARAPAPAPTAATASWIERHELLIHLFMHQVKRMATSQGIVTGASQAAFDKAQQDLMAHTHAAAGFEVPVVVGKGGVGTIPYQLLADARAEVLRLRAELAEALASQGKAGPA